MGKPRDAAYLRWLQEHGVQLNGVALDTFPGSLRGVVALRALSKGDVVVSVPDSLVLLADSGAAADALREAGLVGNVRGAARMSFFAHRTTSSLAAASLCRPWLPATSAKRWWLPSWSSLLLGVAASGGRTWCVRLARLRTASFDLTHRRTVRHTSGRPARRGGAARAGMLVGSRASADARHILR